VFTKEQDIFRNQQLGLIDSQYGVIQKIIPDVPRSNVSLAKPKLGPHSDRLVRSIDANMTNLINQLQQLSLPTVSSMQASPSVPMLSQP